MAKSLGSATVLMAAGTMASRLLGFVKVIVLAYAIGQTASISADSFAVGSVLPNTMFVMLLGGMLNSVLVPQIVQAAKAPDGGVAYINKLLTLVLVLGGALTAFTLLGAPLLVRLNALEWAPEQLHLATAFAYWCLPQLFFYGLYTVMGEVLNARSVFGPYTWAPVLNNLVAILGIVIFIAFFGADPDGLRTLDSWSNLAVALLGGSATLGIAAQALILFVYWKKSGLRYRPDFSWRGVGLGKAARLSSWTLAMFLVLNINTFVMGNVIATDSGIGLSISAVNNAWLIMVLPHSVFVYSLATAYFTRFSEAVANNNKAAFAQDFAASLKQSAVILVFAAAGIFALASQLSRVIQVEASAPNVLLFAGLLQTYIFAMITHSLLFLVQRGFYALSDTRTVFFLTLIQCAVVIPLSLAAMLAPAGSRSFVVVVVQALGTTAQLVVAFRLLKRKMGNFAGREVLLSFAKFGLAGSAAAVLGAGLTALMWVVDPHLNFWLAIFSATLIAPLMLAVYVLLLALLKASEVRGIFAKLRRRFGR